MYIDDKFVTDYGGLINERLTQLRVVDQDERDMLRSKVYERIMTSDNYDAERGAISTWLWNIIRSVVSNERKKKGRSQDALDQHPLDITTTQSHIGAEDAGEAGDEVNRIIASANLPARDESLIRDVYLAGLTVTEAAKKYNIDRRAAEQIVFRTLKKLRNTLHT